MGDPTLGKRDFVTTITVTYSFFTVESVDYKDAPTWTDPHRVVLKVAPDNQLERADVPNAPWG